MSNDAIYVDASAAVKLFVPEEGSPCATDLIPAADGRIASRILYTEVGATLFRRLKGEAAAEALDDWNEIWRSFDVVEVDEHIARHALGLARYHRLGALDAIHLASALRVPAVPMHFLTWDRALAAAAGAVGLRVLPVHD